MNAKTLALLLAIVALVAGGVAGWYYLQNEQLETEVSSSQQTMRELRTAVRALELNQATLENRNDILSQRQQDISAGAENAANELAQLRSQRSDRQAEMATLQTESADLRAELTQADEALRDHENLVRDIAAQKAELAELATAIAERDALLANLQNESVEDEMTMSQMTNQIENLNDELQQAQRQLSGREETVSELNSRLAREQNALTDLQNRLDLARKERQELIGQTNGITVIKLPERILFPSGSAELTEEATTVLQEVAKAIDSFPAYTLSIVGHSDARTISSGLQNAYPSNWELSSARAAVAVRALAKMGVNSDRMKATGVADTQPLVEEVNDATRQQNRRIEVIFEPPLEVTTAGN